MVYLQSNGNGSPQLHDGRHCDEKCFQLKHSLIIPSYPFLVNTWGPEEVMATVSSKWQDSKPSLVSNPCPSFDLLSFQSPAVTMGSMQITIPSTSSSPV